MAPPLDICITNKISSWPQPVGSIRSEVQCDGSFLVSWCLFRLSDCCTLHSGRCSLSDQGRMPAKIHEAHLDYEISEYNTLVTKVPPGGSFVGYESTGL